MKKEIFAQLDGIVGDDVVLSSSTSCLLPSRLFSGLTHVKQCVVAHPVSVLQPAEPISSHFGFWEQYILINQFTGIF